VVTTLTESVTTRQLREDLASVIGRAGYAHERVGITRHGKLAAVVIGVDDLEALEAFEMARDVEELRKAKAADDGERVSLSELRDELDR
jgi:prevent-host-death family protein